SVTNVAHAALELVITDGIDSARPIAVVPFKWEGTKPLPTDISAVIASDLQRSGKFSPVPTSKMPQTPFNESEVNFDAWTNLGVDALLTGTVTKNDQNDYVVNYQLIDVVRGQLTAGQSKGLGSDGQIVVSKDHVLFNKVATVRAPRMRHYAHRISDLVYEELTGERGAFMTRIAYVVVNDQDRFPYQLRVADYDGHDEQLVLRSRQPLMSPSWSPDGQLLAIIKKRSSLHLWNPNSGNFTELIPEENDQIVSWKPLQGNAITWAPDNLHIVVKIIRENQMNLELFNVITGERQNLFVIDRFD
ncbi:MAG: Tol-Pal system protein TolB, partial [Gammaproteobacteria bacterium]